MGGRHAKPIELHLAEGNPNRLTKAEIERRKNSEVKLGLNDLSKIKPPEFVKKDAVALRHWKAHKKEYEEAAKQGIELLTTSDIGVLAMYCKTYSEYERLLAAYQTIDKIAFDSDQLEDYILDSEDLNYKVKNQLRAMIAIDGLLRIETAINKKMDMLLKMQDRLFLNPLAKVKNIPKPKKEEKPTSKFAGFGGIKHG